MDIINSHINNGIFWKTLMDHDAWWSGPESSAAAGLPRKVVLCHHLEPRGHLSVWVDGCWKNFHWLGTREATYTYDGYDSDGYDVCCNMFHMTNMFVLFASYDFATAVAVGLSSLSFLTGADPHQVCNHQQRLKEPVDWVDADSPTHWTAHSYWFRRSFGGNMGELLENTVSFWMQLRSYDSSKGASFKFVDLSWLCNVLHLMSCSRAPNLTNEMTVTTASKRRRNFRASE